MSRKFVIAALHLSAACLILMLPVPNWAKESDPGGKDADGEAEIVFEPTSEGDAAARPTADEKPIDFDAKRPSILGMTVVEGDDGKPHVVDVGASSPAWDAGIRKDDIILSLHGVGAKSFQEWAEGVRKVVADAKAGQTIPVEVLRDSSPLDLQVRISEQKGNRAPRPVKRTRPDIAINQIPPIGEQPVQPGVPPNPVGGGGFGGIGVVDGGVDDGTASDQAPTRAAAQLMAVNNRAGTAQPPIATGGLPSSRLNDATATPPGGTGVSPGTFPDNRNNPTDASGPPINPGTNGTGTSGQVGTAEFADEAGGMLVMVTLGGLPAGNYRVGIGEFSGGAGPVGNAATPNQAIQSQSQSQPERQTRPIQLPGTEQPPGQLQPGLKNNLNPNQQQGLPPVAPAPGAPPTAVPRGAGNAPAGGGASGAKGGGAAQVQREGYYVLAQVAPTAASQQPAGPEASPTPGGVGQPGTTRPTGTIVDSNQAGQPATQPNQRRQAPPPGAMPPTNPNVGTTGQFGIELGVITVRPNGGGTLQQKLEGIRVASVVGQSVLVVAADTPIANNAAGAQAQPAHRNARRDGGTPGGGSLGVVATGVIQLASSRQLTNQQTTTRGTATNQNAGASGSGQGSNVSQPPATGATNPPLPATGATNNPPVNRNQR